MESIVPDVFLSFTRQGHHAVALQVYDVLRAAKIDVYLDEQLEPGESISDELIVKLGESRIMVVIYSAAYNHRWACQWELVHAYLAGAAEGDASRRLLIINPERHERHLLPQVVADLKFLRHDELDQLVGQVRRKLAACPGPMSVVRRLAPPRWLPRGVAGAPGFTGRFPDLWRVHNALSGVDKPVSVAAWSAPAAMVTGMAGIGKSSLARGYGWMFGDTYPGGVFWIGVEGAGGLPAARTRYDDQLRAFARSMGVPAAGEEPDRLAVLLAEYLDQRNDPFLWIVDGLPDNLAADELADFTLPSRLVRMLFTARQNWADTSVAHVELGGVHREDGLDLLDAARPVLPEDRGDALSIVDRLGGHPMALTVVAGRLRGREDLLGYADLARTLTAADAGANVLSAIGLAMNGLSDRDRAVIVLAGLLDPAPIPAALIRDVMAALNPAASAEMTGDALDRLRRAGLATSQDGTWSVHPLVVEAATRLGPPPVPAAAIAPLTAQALLALLDDAGTDPDRMSLLALHARTLAEIRELTGAGRADALRRRVAEHYTRAGDPAQAARQWQRVAATNPHSATDLTAAALAGAANGEYAAATDYARSALNLELSAEERTLAQWALAAALDGLGHFDDADALWAALDAANWAPEVPQRITYDVSRARARIARGRLGQAAELLEPLARLPDGAYDDQVNAARIELARLKLLTSAEIEGRRLAERVVAFYRDRGAPGHIQSMEAQLVWAEAALALALFELRPDTSKWAEAERTVERLATEYPKVSGQDSVFGLAAQVQHALILVRLGKQAECRKVLGTVMPRLRDRLGERHPLMLRARFVLGLTHVQLNEHEEGAAVLGSTWRDQCAVLGPSHPYTLDTALRYGVALKFSDAARAAEILDDTWRRLPPEMGWKNDIVGILRVERFLRWLTPPAMMRAFVSFEERRKRLWDR
jgi:hypothetical protein